MPFFANNSAYLKELIRKTGDDSKESLAQRFIVEIARNKESLCTDLATSDMKLESKMFLEILEAGLCSNGQQIVKLSVSILHCLLDAIGKRHGSSKFLFGKSEVEQIGKESVLKVRLLVIVYSIV